MGRGLRPRVRGCFDERCGVRRRRAPARLEGPPTGAPDRARADERVRVRQASGRVQSGGGERAGAKGEAGAAERATLGRKASRQS